MILYRISNQTYKEDISGNGAAINGSRWNSVNVRMLYTSESISLCILESLVHLKSNNIPAGQFLLKIEVADTAEIAEISVKKIKDGWQTEIEYTRWMGDEFVRNNSALILKVPSVIVPEEHNFLFNPLHKEFKKVKLANTELLDLDKRLFIHQST